jgi:hypothetical protein
MASPIVYYTEKELIQRYADKRNLTYEQIEDVYKAFRKHLLNKLNDFATPTKMGFRVKMLSSFIDRELNIDNLKRGFAHPKYIKAEEQLKYYLTGYIGLRVKKNDNKDNKE